MANRSVLRSVFCCCLGRVTSSLILFKLQASFLPMLRPEHPATPGANSHHLCKMPQHAGLQGSFYTRQVVSPASFQSFQSLCQDMWSWLGACGCLQGVQHDMLLGAPVIKIKHIQSGALTLSDALDKVLQTPLHSRPSQPAYATVTCENSTW